MSLARAAAAVGAVLVPPRCAGCEGPGAWLCDDCHGALEPVSLEVGALRVLAAGSHAGPLRRAIHRFKYREERALATELGALVAERILGDLARGGRIDALVPVPLHRQRVLARGYDQTSLLAEAVAERTGIPVVRAIGRIRHARPQVELDRAERAANVRGAFVGCAGALAGLHAAIVDDVATTGATCAAAAAAARASGARSVRAYVVAADE